LNINYLNYCLDVLKADPYYSSDIYFCNNIISNKILCINDSNRHLITLDDHYTDIYVFKDNFTPGIVRDKTTLKIEITSSALRHELSFSKSLIVERINDLLGKNTITDIIFF
jgi:hypothetical protein